LLGCNISSINRHPPCSSHLTVPSLEASRIHLFLFRMHNRTLGPHFAATHGNPIPVTTLVPDLQVAVQETAKCVAENITERLGAQCLPFAKAVPTVAAACNTALDASGNCLTRISCLDAVQKLCAAIYSCGPPL
jgi:hypothetical protein